MIPRSFANLTRCAFAGALTIAAATPVAAQDTPVDGGALTFAVSPEPPFILTAINTTLQMGMVGSKIMEPLIALGTDLDIRPVLAESWEISEDGLTYTFNLREGVTWHDGEPFTSADVQYTVMEVLKKLHPRGRSSFAKVTEVQTPDEHTAILKLSEPAPPLLVALASGYEAPMTPKHIFGGTDVAANPTINEPIGTGPFVFKEWEKGNYIIVEKNPDYWAEGKPHLDRIVFRIINDASARAAGLESGEIDVAGLSPVPLTDMVRLQDNADLTITTEGYSYMSPFMLMEINTTREPLDDPRVRQAMAYAINRDLMTKVVWMGYGKPATSPIPSPVAAFHAEEGTIPAYPYDTDKAEELLDEAGLPEEGGKRFSMTLDFIPLGTDYQRTAEFIKQQLGKVGIDVTIRSQDLPTFFNRVFTDYDFDATSLYYGAFADPTQGVQRLFWSKSIQPGVVFTNSTGYENPEMDRIIEAAQSENDPEERKALYLEMQKLAMTDLSIIPLMETAFATIANAALENHTITADGVIGGSFADAYLIAD